jgi:asparagine synthase (glutamine-hydrolysing)
MREVHSGPVKTFTIGFTEKQWDEAPLAKKIAQYLGVEHNEFYFSMENTLEIARTAAAYTDEPFADPASIPTLALSRFARQQVTVALSGDGGDEIFWGYNYYKTNPLMYIMYNIMPFGIRRFMSEGLKLLPGDRCLRLSYLLGLKDRLAFQLSPGIWNPNLYYPKLHRYATQLNRRLEIGRDVAVKIKELNWDTKTSAVDIHCSLVDQMLTKIDRASMSTALEVRVPFLDFNVVQLAASIPSHFKTAGGELKHLPRALLSEFIPQSLWDRPKKGFSVPLNSWFTTVLKEWAHDELKSRDHHLCDWLDSTEIQAMFDDHVSGRRNSGRLIWACMQLAGWDRKISSIRQKTVSGNA